MSFKCRNFLDPFRHNINRLFVWGGSNYHLNQGETPKCFVNIISAPKILLYDTYLFSASTNSEVTVGRL